MITDQKVLTTDTINIQSQRKNKVQDMTTCVSGAGDKLLEIKRFSNIKKFSGHAICGIIYIQVKISN